MASSKQIKNRIASVQDTRKITKAMQLIASTKLRKAKDELIHTMPYFDALRGEVKRIFRSVEGSDSPYLRSGAFGANEEDIWGCLVISADKGLAGSYNQNVLKTADALLQRHSNTRLFVVGEIGRQHFRRKGRAIEEDFLFSATAPTIDRARLIAHNLLRLYDRGELKRIYIVYSNLSKGFLVENRCTRLLPLHKDHFLAPDFEKAVEEPFEFVPSPEVVLEQVIHSYLSGFVYSALVDSYCCEQSERMQAMDSATRNADSLLENLSIQYNHLRQAAITQEITEISAGARAQKHKEV